MSRLLLLLSLMATAVASSAETFSVLFLNPSAEWAEVKLYSKTRDRVWPPPPKHYDIWERGRGRVKITCNLGEVVCYTGKAKGRNIIWGLDLKTGKCNPKAECCFECLGQEIHVEFTDPVR